MGRPHELARPLLETYQEQAEITRDVPADHIARVLVGLLHGFVIRRAVLGDGDAEIFRNGLRALTPAA